MAPAGVLYAARHHQCQRQRSLELNSTVQRLPNPFQDLCVPSRISALLLAFHAHTWVFGAAYYWLTWALLGKAASETCLNHGILMCFRFPGCWSGSQHLGVVSARPSLRAHRGPHWLRRWRGASTSQPFWLIWEIDFDVQRSYLHIAWFWLSIYFCVPFKYLLTHFDVFSVEFRWD